ncbi:hypothetical protein Tco_1047797 [Tanacetum coccineum]
MQMKSVFYVKSNQDPLGICCKSQYDNISLQHLSVCIQQSSTSTTISTILVWINLSQSTLPIHLSITTLVQSVIRSTIIFILVSNESSKNLNYQFPKLLYQSPQVTTQPMTESPLVDSGFAVPVFSLGDDPNACLNKAMAFLTHVASSRGDKVKVILDLDIYDYDCDDILNAKSVPVANISNYGSDVISEVPHSETYLNDMENQGVHAMQDFEQTLVVDFTNNEIHSDSNIIPHS